ncbi:MAG: TrmH family RNA methyltransferase [Thermodesulfobacteriota bacterium]
MHNRTERRKERIRSVLEKRQPDLTLILDNIHDPHNVSAILRSCDAFAVPRVHLYYTSESFPAPGRKSSASARKWVQMQKNTSANSMVEDLRSQGFQILGTGCGSSAIAVYDWDLTQPTAIVLGNEHQGLSPELTQYLDAELEIPMQGMVPSLNVSVAAAVILYECFRQRKDKGLLPGGGYDPQTLERIFEDWCKK